MSHIRLQRAQPGYNPNVVHVLHGLDADLIMLALATHEAHFYISREEVLFGRKSEEQAQQRRLENGFTEAQKQLDEAAGSVAMQLPANQAKTLQRVSIPILREYLAAEFDCVLQPRSLPFPISLERLIDDIVFLCFFVGNDFLPHLPSLDIRDGALDFLFNVYKRVLPDLGDYITKSGGQVNLRHVDVVLAEVGAIEDYVFAMKHESEQRMARQRDEQKKGKAASHQKPPLETPKIEHAVRGRAARVLEREKTETPVTALGGQRKDQAKPVISFSKASDNAEAARLLKESLFGDSVGPPIEDNGGNLANGDDNQDPEDQRHAKGNRNESHGELEGINGSKKRKLVSSDALGGDAEVPTELEDSSDIDDLPDEDEDEDDEAPVVEVPEVDPEVARAFKEKIKAKQQAHLDSLSQSVEDNVRLHEAGWKDRYYKDKCKADDVEAHGGREHLFRSYIVGLVWVMKYYYSGVCSWKWYFPFHYAPFASDLKNIERFENDCKSFQLAKPFNPVEQLLAVLPPDSVHAVPKESQWLMTDPESPIIDFYPNDVPVDPNGKAMPWLWVVLLPFIDEDRLLDALLPTQQKWTSIEMFCNSRGLDDGYLYIHKKYGLSKKIAAVLKEGSTAQSPKTRLTDSALYGSPGFSGLVRPPLGNELFSPDSEVTIKRPAASERISSSDPTFLDDIHQCEAICVAFTEPPKLPHKSVLLPGVKQPRSVLTPDDKRIRRPRLNRGGGTIANLGMAPSGQSHQSGYGSMNMGNYERGLADRTGRGRDMYQTGARAWGAMEPTPKRFQAGVTAQVSNPLLYQQHQQRPNQWQSLDQRPQQQHVNPGLQQYPNHNYSDNRQNPHPSYQHPASTYYPQWQGGNQNFQHFNDGDVYSQRPRQPPPPPPPPPHHNQGFNFRGFAQQNAPAQRGPPQVRQQHSRASADVMDSLRAQLSSTIQQNRRGASDQR
jgi:5'-3' exoribonuclease 2